MEDWQEWQVRADQVAASLSNDIDKLEQNLNDASENTGLRNFWSRFRELKDAVRTAPAIKLDDKLSLERRLRDIGSRAYKVQEVAMTQSNGKKDEILPRISGLKEAGQNTDSPQALREIRRNLDAVRKDFDSGGALVPADRQIVWDAWRDASQFVWQRLTDIWESNEKQLQGILTEAREKLESGDPETTRRLVGRFFDQLKTSEGRQNTVTGLKSEANAIRGAANRAEEDRAAKRLASVQAQQVPTVDTWKLEVDRNKESISRLSDEIQNLERELQDTPSILEQAMLRGPLVEKKRKLGDLERTNKTLEQRIEQSETSPLIRSA